MSKYAHERSSLSKLASLKGLLISFKMWQWITYCC